MDKEVKKVEEIKYARCAVTIDSVAMFGCPECGKKEYFQVISPAKGNPVKAYMYQCKNRNCETFFCAFAEAAGPNPFQGEAGRSIIKEHPFAPKSTKTVKLQKEDLIPA